MYSAEQTYVIKIGQISRTTKTAFVYRISGKEMFVEAASGRVQFAVCSVALAPPTVGSMT